MEGEACSAGCSRLKDTAASALHSGDSGEFCSGACDPLVVRPRGLGKGQMSEAASGSFSSLFELFFFKLNCSFQRVQSGNYCCCCETSVKIVPRFNISFGSKTFFKARMESSCSSEYKCFKSPVFNFPTPCSAQTEPP